MPGKGPSAVPEMGGRGTQSPAVVKLPSRKASKKMVQARLPFKRLNPVPKDEGVPQGKKPNLGHIVPLNSTPGDLTLEDMENGCQMETEEVYTLPKAINGRGPLDHYIKKTSKPCHVPPDLTIDLTDSNSGLDQPLLNRPAQTLSPDGTVLEGSDPLSSLTSTQTDKVHKDLDCLKQANSVNRCSVSESQFTDGMKELPHPVAMLSVTSPVKGIAEDTDLSAEERDASSSSTSSPVSASSPEALSGTQLRDTTNSVSPTHIHKEKEQEDKRRKLQAEKEERDRVKEEVKVARERAKEEAKKKKDEEKEQRAKEKRERKEKEDREKAEKLRLKEEKKKEKLDAMEARQEEKRKKEEEKRIKEEEKRSKAEKAEITRFLQKPKTSRTPKTFAQSCGKFAPFEIKRNMAVAPLCRVEFEQELSEQLDKLLEEQISKGSFLSEIKGRRPRRMGRTVMPQGPHLTSDSDEVQMLEETDASLTEKPDVPERRTFGKMKLLQFCENYRPAYWGTWNRSSVVICPRKPWAQDTKLFDYEMDSDEEWVEEEPGESLSHSEGDEDDDEPKEDDDEDDGFFVPHGYLSEDEGGVSDEECKNPENQKVRQRLKAKEWDELQSKGKKINVLKPLVIGCVWLGSSTAETQFLQKFAVCILDTVINEEDMIQEINSVKSLEDREILMHLLPLLHGNVNGSKTIIQEFQECWRSGLLPGFDTGNATLSESSSPNAKHQTPSQINVPSKARMKRIITENSVYEKRPDHRLCWYVHSDVLKSFQQESLPVPCQWTYITQVNLSSREESGAASGQMQSMPTSGKRKSAGSMTITKFMKKTKDIGTMNDAEATETDGFQADTEEDADEEDECDIVEVQSRKVLMHLLPLLHGNVNGSKTIIQEFQEYWRRGLLSGEDTGNSTLSEVVSPNAKNQTLSQINVPSKARLKRIITENSVYEKRPDHRLCWYVHLDVLKSFQQESLPVPCQWTYITQVNSSIREESGAAGRKMQSMPTSGKRKSAGSMTITKFMIKAKEMGTTNDAGATDGFQADTEEETDEDDEDCVIVEVQSKQDEDAPSSSCTMEINLTEETVAAPIQT
ncbi:chromatin assembly factor 1 subunit A isoform X2 [Pseudophryne corroboree]|uniref:chromatin assembly factor 1 subunit A isoform X2 n=1 Tax=Pseudophryne corroboree TaxID=495146 RepID=UPI003081F122